MIAGDEKPQSRRRMLSTGGLVSIKNSCQKKGKKKQRVWRELGCEVNGGNQQEKKRTEETEVHHVDLFIPHAPLPSPDGQRGPTCDSA